MKQKFQNKHQNKYKKEGYLKQVTQASEQTQSSTEHVPVLLQHVLDVLAPQLGETYLDATAGYAGHAQEILARTQNPTGMTLVDRDEFAIDYLQSTVGKLGVSIVANDFLSASQDLREQGQRYDMILADLGVSSPHLNNGDRGFAFRFDGPLDMRMDQTQELTAAHVVNTYDEEALAKVIKRYGEEPRARKVAQLIVEHRPVTTTTELAEIVKKAYPRYTKTHPATRTFQALRIEVNDELRLVELAIPVWLELLKPGGRLAIISFHSLEDRIVKDAFKEMAGDRYDVLHRMLTKRPLVADESEIVFNPRARSSKLRAVAKINNQKEREMHANPG